ncbi:hypothetical protein KL951_002923 [Ogataea haglerorum]|nr:hypothetical protein KL951_002923 [Ogataea haglerorum]
MGKLKKRSRSAKLAAQRKPGAFKDDKEFQKIAPLLDKLKSDAINDRSMAVGAINTLCDTDPEIRKTFLKNDLVRTILTKLVHDSSDEVVVESFGLLRNLIIEEGYDLSVFLWRSDIWTVLENAFKKASVSIEHVDDDKVSAEQRRLLFDYIENIIACLGSLCLEISTEMFHSDVLPKLVSNDILKFIIVLIERNYMTKLTLSALEFLYDLSTISAPFIEAFSQDENIKQILSGLKLSNDLSEVYLIGLHFQTLEFSNGLDDNQTIQITDSLLAVANKVAEANSRDESSLKVYELVLDIFATIVEIKGQEEPVSTKISGMIESHVVPFLRAVFEFSSVKVLLCLTNILCFYRNETPESVDELVNFVRPAVLQQLSQRLGEPDLETINLYLGYLAVSSETSSVDELKPLAEVLLKFAMQLGEITPVSAQIIGHLLHILTKIGKHCNDLELTTNITKLIVDKNFVEPISYYNSTRLGDLRKKHRYLIEMVLLDSINSIFDLFDDDYPYNKPIYHEGGLHQVLKDNLPHYKKIYKAIDKNSEPQLKALSEEAFQNLERFIQYKEGEVI